MLSSKGSKAATILLRGFIYYAFFLPFTVSFIYRGAMRYAAFCSIRILSAGHRLWFFFVSLNSSSWMESVFRETCAVCVSVSVQTLGCWHSMESVFIVFTFFSFFKQKRILSVKFYVVNLEPMFTCWQKCCILEKGAFFFTFLWIRINNRHYRRLTSSVCSGDPTTQNLWFAHAFSFIFKCYYLHNHGIVLWERLNIVSCCLYWND